MRANRDQAIPPTLDAAAKMVYRCAISHSTLAETAQRCGIEFEMLERIVARLIADNLVSLNGQGGNTQTAEPRRQTTPNAQRSFRSFEETETFVDKLETLFVDCQRKNYYDLLGVETDATRTELRNRYFELSKRYHPDKAFLHEAIEHKDKMAVVFRELTLAYETLSNKNKRAAYDATIADQLELRAIEKSLKAAVANRTPTNTPGRRSAPSEGSTSISAAPGCPSQSAGPASGTPPPDAPTGGGASSLRSTSPPRASTFNSSPPSPDAPPTHSAPPERISGRPASISTPPNVKRFRPSQPARPDAERQRLEMKRRLAGRAMADLLSRRSMPPSPAVDVEQKLAEAELAIDKEQFGDAVNLIKCALKAQPEHERGRALLADAVEGLARTQVRLHLRRSRFAKRDGERKQAEWHLEQALAIDSANLEARHLLAELALEAGNLERALSYMKEVVTLGGQRARYFATIGEIFLANEDTVRAADAFSRALSIEPDNKEIKKRLKLCSR